MGWQEIEAIPTEPKADWVKWEQTETIQGVVHSVDMKWYGNRGLLRLVDSTGQHHKISLGNVDLKRKVKAAKLSGGEEIRVTRGEMVKSEAGNRYRRFTLLVKR